MRFLVVVICIIKAVLGFRPIGQSARRVCTELYEVSFFGATHD